MMKQISVLTALSILASTTACDPTASQGYDEQDSAVEDFDLDDDEVIDDDHAEDFDLDDDEVIDDDHMEDRARDNIDAESDSDDDGTANSDTDEPDIDPSEAGVDSDPGSVGYGQAYDEVQPLKIAVHDDPQVVNAYTTQHSHIDFSRRIGRGHRNSVNAKIYSNGTIKATFHAQNSDRARGYTAGFQLVVCDSSGRIIATTPRGTLGINGSGLKRRRFASRDFTFNISSQLSNGKIRPSDEVYAVIEYAHTNRVWKKLKKIDWKAVVKTIAQLKKFISEIGKALKKQAPVPQLPFPRPNGGLPPSPDFPPVVEDWPTGPASPV